VPKKYKYMLSEHPESLGQRMARLRKGAGFTQRQLAAELGISQRMVAYYEAQAEHPPTHIIPPLAQLLGVSADEILGVRPIKPNRPDSPTLWRRVRQIEKLPPRDKRQLLGLIDTFLDRNRLAQRGA
jgi:transcriptional regulator with XRE-family HTH domain